MIYEFITAAVVAILAFSFIGLKRKDHNKIPFSKRLQDRI